MFLAERHGLQGAKTHPAKVDLAEQLGAQDLISVEVSGLLKILNQARKDTMYDGEELDLEGWTLEDVAIVVESLVESAEAASG